MGTADPGAGRASHDLAPARDRIATASLRPPVPLQLTPHTVFFVEALPQAVPTAALAAEPRESAADSAATARLMVEADGYRNVSALVKASDGAWTGIAMRGATKVAVSVDASGRVTAQ
jgi:hypothetical protein